MSDNGPKRPERVLCANPPELKGWTYDESMLFQPYISSVDGQQVPMRIAHYYRRSFPGKSEGDLFPLPCGHGRMRLDYSTTCRKCKQCKHDFTAISLSSDRADRSVAIVYATLSQVIPQGVTFVE